MLTEQQQKELKQLMEDYLNGLITDSETVNRFILIMTGKELIQMEQQDPSKIKHHFRVGPEFDVKIYEDNKMIVESIDAIDGPVTVQLADDAEAEKAIKEAQDMEGELMYEEGSVFGKYKELHQFRP